VNAAIDSKALAHVGPGTPMGRFMREYWLPALMSSELQSGGAPVRLMLLGEKLVAFRDGNGKIGIMHERCPHRGVSLFLGRNEPDGLRCIYHGWQFGANGRCIDMPSIPPQQRFKEKVRVRSYPTIERAGVIWAYMGTRAEAPPLPAFEATMLPETEVSVYCIQRECNWLQVAEGDLDTSHFGFLHMGSIDPEDMAPDNLLRHTAENRVPDFSMGDAPWGTSYAAFRETADGQTYWRFANFLFPCWTQSPQGPFEDHIDARAFVPMDDGHTMLFHFSWRKKSPPLRAVDKHGQQLPGLRNNNDLLPNTTDWFGRWRTRQNAGNDWEINREAQRDGTIYSGIDNLRVQDQAAVESMGPIVDHSLEQLAPTDQMVARTRRRLIKAVQSFLDGVSPPGVDDPAIFFAARSGYFLTSQRLGWQDAYRIRLEQAVRAASLSSAAE
jgi:phthalate 4,5-dioxygenase